MRVMMAWSRDCSAVARNKLGGVSRMKERKKEGKKVITRRDEQQQQQLPRTSDRLTDSQNTRPALLSRCMRIFKIVCYIRQLLIVRFAPSLPTPYPPPGKSQLTPHWVPLPPPLTGWSPPRPFSLQPYLTYGNPLVLRLHDVYTRGSSLWYLHIWTGAA